MPSGTSCLPSVSRCSSVRKSLLLTTCRRGRHHHHHRRRHGSSSSLTCRVSADEPSPAAWSKLLQGLRPTSVARAGASAWVRLIAGSSAAAPYAALFGVAILWGSYAPALRFLFLSDDPPSPALLNALQACLPAPFLIASGLYQYLFFKKPRPIPISSVSERSMVLGSMDWAGPAAGQSLSSMDVFERDVAGATPSPGTLSESESRLAGEGQGCTLQAALADAAALDEQLRQQQGGTAASALASLQAPPPRAPANAFERVCANALNWRSDSLAVAGAELGLWLFLDYGLEVLGVQLISATKAAFLNQATVLITPLLVHLSGQNVRRLDWAACSVALVGSILVAADGIGGAIEPAAAQAGALVDGAAVAAADQSGLGYLYTMLSAVFFALSTVRMGRYMAPMRGTPAFSSLELATASTCSLGLLSLVWVFASVHGELEGVAATVSMLGKLFTDPATLAVLLWVGVGPGALAAFLQAAGQQTVPPAQAQLIYATTPIFATALAMSVLDASDEAMGTVAWGGAVLMLAASLLASVGATEHEAV